MYKDKLTRYTELHFDLWPNYDLLILELEELNFLSGPVVKSLHFHYREHSFDP